jgi:flagellar biosynthesis/type III secretory pathway protein FliH
VVPDVDLTADDLVLSNLVRPRRGALTTAVAVALVILIGLGAIAGTTLVLGTFHSHGASGTGLSGNQLAQVRASAFDAGRKSGLMAGLAQGRAAGVRIGLRTGLARGVKRGKAQGYRTGYTRGSRDAYSRGFADAQKSYTTALASFNKANADLHKQLNAARTAVPPPSAPKPTP